MTCCDQNSIIYPLVADVYYPDIAQSPYGNVSKSWKLDASISCAFNVAGSKNKQDVLPNPSITIDNFLIGRTYSDIRISSQNIKNSITNILITNIRDKNSNSIYNETSGPRAGKPTIFEVATNDPIVGPFGKVEYYKVVIRRSENQGVDI